MKFSSLEIFLLVANTCVMFTHVSSELKRPSSLTVDKINRNPFRKTFSIFDELAEDALAFTPGDGNSKLRQSTGDTESKDTVLDALSGNINVFGRNNNQTRDGAMITSTTTSNSGGNDMGQSVNGDASA